MTRSAYLRYEALRHFRNVRFVIFSLAWPLILFFAVAGPQRRHTFDGIGFPLYFMTGMAVLRPLIPVISARGGILPPGSPGWTPPLRHTPRPSRRALGAELAHRRLQSVPTDRGR